MKVAAHNGRGLKILRARRSSIPQVAFIRMRSANDFKIGGRQYARKPILGR